MESYDVAVIGLGPGGEHVAGTLAERGLRVLGVDNGLVGGECPYWGCIRSKMMIRAANSLAEARRVAQLAGSIAHIRPDWTPAASPRYHRSPGWTRCPSGPTTRRSRPRSYPLR